MADQEKEPEVLIIRASEWSRGHTSSLLETTNTPKYRKKGTMCCIGLDARRCGIPDIELAGIGGPDSLDGELHKLFPDYFARWLSEKKGMSPACVNAISVNDERPGNEAWLTYKFQSDDERIEKLRPIFAQFGITIDWRPNE